MGGHEATSPLPYRARDVAPHLACPVTFLTSQVRPLASRRGWAHTQPMTNHDTDEPRSPLTLPVLRHAAAVITATLAVALPTVYAAAAVGILPS